MLRIISLAGHSETLHIVAPPVHRHLLPTYTTMFSQRKVSRYACIIKILPIRNLNSQGPAQTTPKNGNGIPSTTLLHHVDLDLEN